MRHPAPVRERPPDGSAGFMVLSKAQSPGRLNSVIRLLEHRQAVFGVYAPSNRRAGANGSAAIRTPAQLARDARGYSRADFLFDGSMEHDFDGAFPAFVRLTQAMTGAARDATAAKRLQPPLIVKTHKIAPDTALAAARIARQLNQGAAGIVFVEAESAAEVEAGLAAMRFPSHGGGALRLPDPCPPACAASPDT